MKCCGSPTTSIAASDMASMDDKRRVENAMQAVVFAEILKPLAKSLGPFGELATGSIAQDLFARPEK
jgi:hypothetical protein